LVETPARQTFLVTLSQVVGWRGKAERQHLECTNLILILVGDVEYRRFAFDENVSQRTVEKKERDGGPLIL
jgi:hypothetical protein